MHPLGLTSATQAGEARVKRAVLDLVRTLHPDHLTFPNLVRAMVNDAEDFAEGDAITRAVRDFTGLGLLQCRGGFVIPTRAAFECNQGTLWLPSSASEAGG
jgi:hypothetical protein